jgi:type IV pilus assembly protein PilC
VVQKRDAPKERFNRKAKVSSMSVVVFTRQLSTMITSGLPLVQSLDILANQIEDKNLRV